jgi:hypothetical protein
MLPSSLYNSLLCLQSCSLQDFWAKHSDYRAIYFLFSPLKITVVPSAKIPSYTRVCFNSHVFWQKGDNEARCFNAGTHKALVTLKCHMACLCNLVWKHHVEPVPFFAVPSGDVPSFASQQWHWSDVGNINLTLNPKVRGFDSRLCHWDFILTSGRPIALVLTQPLTEIITRNISWRVKEAGA